MGSLLDDDWSYDARPDIEPRDQVRELVGDTDKNTKLVSDTSIELALSMSGGQEQVAASEIAKKIAARFAKEATTKSGKDYSRSMDRHKAYLDLADRLRAADATAIGYAAQLRCSTTQAIYAQNDIRRGAFRTGMFHTSEFDPRGVNTDQALLDDARELDNQ